MATTKAQSNVTTDHDEIRRWAEARDAQPACVKGTGNQGDVGMLRLDFPGFSGEESLQHIGWDEWFDKFDERGLALLYQEQTAGGAQSNFNKLVSRETAQAAEKGRATRKRSARTTSTRKTSARKTGGRTAAHRKAPAKKTAASKRAKTVAKRAGKSTAKGSRKSTRKSSRSR